MVAKGVHNFVRGLSIRDALLHDLSLLPVDWGVSLQKIAHDFSAGLERKTSKLIADVILFLRVMGYCCSDIL